MRYYQLTEETKMTSKGAVYRIQSTGEIKGRNIPVGTFGGFVCPHTVLTGGAWVEDEAMVWNSKLNDQVTVGGEAEVYDSQLKGNCFITAKAKLEKVKGTGVYVAGDAEVKDSHFGIRKHRDIAIRIAGSVKVDNCNITYAGNETSVITIGDKVQLIGTDVTGSNIRFSGKSHVRNSTIMGDDLDFVDVEYADRIDVSGNQIHFWNNKLLRNTGFKGADMAFRGTVEVENCKIAGDDIHVTGGGVVMKEMELDGKQMSILDFVHAECVTLIGKEIVLKDQVRIKGFSNQHVILQSKTTIKDIVNIEMEEGKVGLFMNETLSGDFVYTGN